MPTKLGDIDQGRLLYAPAIFRWNADNPRVAMQLGSWYWCFRFFRFDRRNGPLADLLKLVSGGDRMPTVPL